MQTPHRKVSQLSQDSNWEPSCCEVTVLTLSHYDTPLYTSITFTIIVAVTYQSLPQQINLTRG